jgi:hypothetical protein
MQTHFICLGLSVATVRCYYPIFLYILPISFAFLESRFSFSFVRCPSQQLDPQKTVFVGALHGMLNAEGLCAIFNDLFGGVIYASKYCA